MRYILVCADQHFIDVCEGKFGPPSVIVTENNCETKADIRFSFHSCYAADYGVYQNYEGCHTEAMKTMADCQAQYYRMADRFSINREFNFRANSYYKHLGTWTKLLKGVECVVFSNVPHEGYDWVMYNVAKMMGIKTYIFYIMPMLPGLPVIKYLITDALQHCQSAIPHGLQDYPKKMVDDFLEGYSKALSGELYEPYTGAIPLSTVVSSKLYGTNLSTIIPKIKKALYRSFYSLFRLIEGDAYSTINKQRSRYWDKAIPINDYKKVLYFPLHYQPECTSSPLGGHFVEQDLLIKMIAEALPKDTCLLVKDHPRSSLKLRYRQFFEDIKILNNVYFVDHIESSKPLLARADAVVGLTGTSLWEALFMKKPVLMAGSIIYENAPNTKKISHVNDVKQALLALDELVVDGAAISAYLDSLKPFLFPGVISPKDEGAYSPVSPADSAKYSLQALMNALTNDGLLKRG